MFEYPAKFVKEEKFYFAEFVDFSHAFTQGTNLKELKFNLQEVLSMAIEHNLDNNIPIPLPSKVEGKDIIYIQPFPEIRQKMNKKINNLHETANKYAHIKLKFEVVEKMKEIAKTQNKTITSIVNDAVDEYLKKLAS